jgi:hypothetical protein
MENFERLSAKLLHANDKTTKEKNNETPILVFLFCGFAVTAQNSSSKEFTYTEFLGYVKNTIH